MSVPRLWVHDYIETAPVSIFYFRSKLRFFCTNSQSILCVDNLGNAFLHCFGPLSFFRDFDNFPRQSIKSRIRKNHKLTRIIKVDRTLNLTH